MRSGTCGPSARMMPMGCPGGGLVKSSMSERWSLRTRWHTIQPSDTRVCRSFVDPGTGLRMPPLHPDGSPLGTLWEGEDAAGRWPGCSPRGSDGPPAGPLAAGEIWGLDNPSAPFQGGGSSPRSVGTAGRGTAAMTERRGGWRKAPPLRRSQWDRAHRPPSCTKERERGGNSGGKRQIQGSMEGGTEPVGAGGWYTASSVPIWSSPASQSSRSSFLQDPGVGARDPSRGDGGTSTHG